MAQLQQLPVEDISLSHLQAELNRIDLLIRREIHRWQLAGQDFHDHFRGTQNSEEEIEGLLTRSFGVSWGQTTDLSPSQTDEFVSAYEQAIHQVEQVAEQAYHQQQVTRLMQLGMLLKLNSFEYDVLLVCLAPMIDLRYERFYGFLQDDVTRKHPSVDLMLSLLAPAGPQRLTYLSHFAETASLIKYHLLEKLPDPLLNNTKPSLLRQPFRVDEAVVSWLLGQYQPHRNFAKQFQLIIPQITEVDRLLTTPLQSHLPYLTTTKNKPIAVFYGPDETSQESAAQRLAAHHKQLLLRIDLKRVVEAKLPLLLAIRIALRDAQLTGAIPYLYGWDVCVKDSAPPIELLSELCDYPNLIIIAGEKPWQAQGISRERVLLWLEFDRPSYSQRRALWIELLKRGLQDQEQITMFKQHYTTDIDELAGQFTLTSGQIRDAVATANDMTNQRIANNQPESIATQPIDQSPKTINRQDLFAAARAHSNPRLIDLARKITPRYNWQDLILPTDLIAMLRELVATVKGRPKVLEEWGVGKKLASSSGVTVLFAGPPGTGKTMAAEVIAGELGLDLYKINLSSVVSKYIGETEKNLERIFNEAQSSNAILFFDEADSIFGKRSEVKDARDRYANLEVSYLLQRMEAYDGVTILATNLRSNLDEAFTRRLQFALDVPFPREEYRLQIWQTLFPNDVPHQDDLDFEFMAKRYKLSGGNIRNVIVGAAYLAAADGGMVTMEHLLHATRRELQKMGRLVADEDVQLPDKKRAGRSRTMTSSMQRTPIRMK